MDQILQWNKYMKLFKVMLSDVRRQLDVKGT